MLGTGIYFMTYESIKQTLTSYRRDKSPTNPFSVLFAGGLCGVASWALIYPIDSAKSIYQRNCLTSYEGGVVKKAPKIEFFNKRLYRGLGVSMGRSCLVNSIFFSSFEFVKKKINALEDWTRSRLLHTWEAKSILINGVTLLSYSDVPVSEYLGIPYQEFTMELHCTFRYRFRFCYIVWSLGVKVQLTISDYLPRRLFFWIMYHKPILAFNSPFICRNLITGFGGLCKIEAY